MTIELVNKKREDLVAVQQQQLALQDKFNTALRETAANLLRIEGGILDCDHWIKQLTPTEEKPEVLEPVIDSEMEVVD